MRAIEEHEARIAILSIAVQELFKALPPASAQQVRSGIQARLATLPPLPESIDAPIAGEVAALLESLSPSTGRGA